MPTLAKHIRARLWQSPWVQTTYALHRARRAGRELARCTPQATPILVYQMGKVGSSTVARTLESLGLERDVHHLHYMTREELEVGRTRHLRATGRLPYDWCLGRALGKQIRSAPPPGPIPIVTLVRDPIARELSGLFQVPEFAERELRNATGALDPPRVLAYLHHRFERVEAGLGPELWFDRELRTMFDLDVLDLPFPKHRGWEIYQNRRTRLLLLRMEDLDHTLGPALATFLRLPDTPKTVRANERSRSGDAATYAEVLRRFRLPRARVEALYRTRVPQHFYDADTLRRFVQRWSDH